MKDLSLVGQDTPQLQKMTIEDSRVKNRKGRCNTSESLGAKQRAKSGSRGKDLSESSSIRLDIPSGNAIESIAEEQDKCASKMSRGCHPAELVQ
jgi:hypothetical protein